VKSNSLYAFLLVSLFSTFIDAKRDPIVPVDSSAARIPFPSVQIYLAVAISSPLKFYLGSIIK